MATPKFVEHLGGPFTNNSDEFILMLVSSANGNTPIGLQSPSGALYVIQNNSVGQDSTAYPIVSPLQMSTKALIPPGFTVQVSFIGLQGSLEDLRGYI